MTYTKPTTTSSAASTSHTCGCGCGCHDQAAHSEGCCKLTCFERPNYFCGQLLSDADLTLQETYFREKNKLYHRTMDGYGVVCGLRMRCDGDCKGHITIGDGYAIDCCGNDLLVCKPKSFDVIGELRKKKWLIEMPRDPCREHRHEPEHQREHEHGQHHREHEDDCITKQCFYIGICYEEQPATYVAPYTTDCSAAPGPCQPTRIREGVRFEVYDKLPCRPNPLDEIEKRIERCFRIFREGQFSKGLELLAPRILQILRCKEMPEPNQPNQPKNPNEPQPREPQYNPNHTFQELRALFLHQLRICPDQYNCNLEHDVCAIRPPGRDEQRDEYRAQESFTRLFELIQRYVFSCVLAEFAFLCPEPPEACCVLIGSVEVENGRLTRVINYPRWYLWCFANFFEVMMYTLANEAACGREDSLQTEGTREEDRRHRKDRCCPEFEVNVCEFVSLFDARTRGAEDLARAFPQALSAMKRALVDEFAFMKPNRVAASTFNNLSDTKARTLADAFQFNLESLEGREAGPRDWLSAIAEHGIIRRGQAIVHESANDKITRAAKVMGASANAVGPYPAEFIAKLAADVAKLNYTSDLEARIARLEAQAQHAQGIPTSPVATTEAKPQAAPAPASAAEAKPEAKPEDSPASPPAPTPPAEGEPK